MVLLSLSSLIYAAERGAYRHYVGFVISGGSFSDNLQRIDVASDNTDESSDNTDEPSIGVVDSDFEEGGSLFVWDRFDLDNRGALSLMFLSVWEDGSGTYSDGSTYDAEFNFGGPLVVGKYFTGSGLYIGGGGALLSMYGDGRIEDDPIFSNANLDYTSDSFFTPTVVLGYRGLVGRFESSHVYIGADWIRTLPVDVDYEVDFEIFGSGRTISGTLSDTFEELSITMLAVSFGWAW